MSADLNKLKNAPTDEEVAKQTEEAKAAVSHHHFSLVSA